MCIMFLAGAVRSYSYHQEMKSFSDARASCARSGGDLATFNSTAEQEVVLPGDIYNENGDWWVGLHQKDGGEEWYWTSGLQVSWTNWASGAPNNRGSGLCARLTNSPYHPPGWWWDDFRCSRKYNYICETIKALFVYLV